MRKKIIMTAVGVIAVGCAAFLLFFRGNRTSYSMRFEKVSKGNITVYVTATGTINAVTTVDVGTQVSGIVSKLYADFNSVVREGQVIAQIDSTFLVQAVRDASASLERARAQYQDSKRTLDRTKMLLEKQLESQANYDGALTNYEAASASLKQAEASLERAKINLAYATIYAPINGVVIDRKVNVGQTVAASFSSPTLFTIANDLKKMQVQTTVDESDIGRVSIGQTATFTVDAYPEQKFSGVVSQIRLAPVNIQNVVNYTVIIDVNNDDLKLMPGMTANVKILVASREDVLRVPNMALRLQPPTDIIDTMKVNEMRERFTRQRDESGDSTSMAASKIERPTMSGGSAEYTAAASGSPGMPWRSKRFQEVRDSLVAKYGTTIDRSELRNKIMAVLKNDPSVQKPRSTKTETAPKKREQNRFGITNIFPEYQKSAYDPNSDNGRGRVWILNPNGKLVPVPVVTGLNDGRYTEIVTPQLKDGDQIVIGVASNNADVASQQGRSPLVGPSPGMGGRGR